MWVVKERRRHCQREKEAVVCPELLLPLRFMLSRTAARFRARALLLGFMLVHCCYCCISAHYSPCCYVLSAAATAVLLSAVV